MSASLVVLLACTAPPPLEVSAPQGPVAGALALPIRTDAPWIWLAIDVGEPARVEDGEVTLDTTQWPDGPHIVTVRARTWTSQPAEVAVVLTTDNSGPTVSLSPRSSSVEQGHTLPIVVQTDEDATVEVRFLDRDRHPYPIGPRTWRSLVGVPIRTEAGSLPLAVSATDPLGNRTEHTMDVQVLGVDWPFTGKLPLSKRKARVDPPAMVTMRQERDAVYATASPEERWSGTMTLPVHDADHTSPYGTFREYPDGKRSFHDAEDLARKRWTPIHAAADGVVALAHYQEVHGNAVLIDHGHKVVSLYSHLQKHDVVAGQAVATGDRLGWMGSTGRSTGPHLHWGVVVDEVAVDPMQWTTESFDAGAFSPAAE